MPSSHARAYQGIEILIENLINDNDVNTDLFKELDLETLPTQVLDYHRLFSSLQDDDGNYTDIIDFLNVLMIEDYECLFESDDGNSPCSCCDGYRTNYYQFENFTIEITESETRFQEEYSHGWDASITCDIPRSLFFKSIMEHKDELLMLSGDVESNPGPTFRIKIEEKIKEKKQLRDPKILSLRDIMRGEKKIQKNSNLRT